MEAESGESGLILFLNIKLNFNDDPDHDDPEDDPGDSGAGINDDLGDASENESGDAV